jgi:hypothetical protein
MAWQKVTECSQSRQGLIAAIATMNKTLMDKLHKLQNGAAAEVAIGFADLFVSRWS